jgi:nucleoside-diphosphate-sugar epimerase
VTSVLITCAGSGVGQSVVDSLKHLKGEYRIIASDQSRHVYSVPDCDEFVALPRISDPDYVTALLEACARTRADIVVPGHDQELALFAGCRERFEAAGVEVLVGDAPLVALMRDKLAWSRAFRRHTSRVIESRAGAECRASGPAFEGHSWPLIAKPSGGSASAGVMILRHEADLAAVPDDYVVQPFLFPSTEDPDYEPVRQAVEAGRVAQLSEISVQLAYAKDGELLGRFASRNRLKAGVPVEILPIDHEDVWDAVDEVIAALAHYSPRGPINLQGRLTDRGLVFFEMNPRFTGITGNRAQFGFNEVSLLVDNFLTGAKRRLFVNLNKVGVRQVACRTWPRARFTFGRAAPSGTPRTVAVLGCTSWLAHQIVDARAAAGDTVVAVCRDPSRARAEALYASMPRVHVVSDSSPSCKDALAFADVLVNCASARPPMGTAAIVDAHVYQMRMLDLAEACEVPRIINISSQSVYAADGTRPQGEDAPVDAAEPYAFSKYLIEQHVRSMSARRPSIASVSLRLARLFGPAPGMRRDEFPHKVVAHAVADLPIELRSSGDVLDLIDVRDAAAAISFFVDEENATWRGEVYNVGSGDPVSVGAYVELAGRVCRERFDRTLRVVVRDGDHRRGRIMECRKLAEAGWRPRIPLHRSIDDLFEYFTNAH